MRLLGMVGQGVYGNVYATDNGKAVKVLRSHEQYEDELVSRARELFIGSYSDIREGVAYFPTTDEFATLTPLANCTLGELAPSGHLCLHIKRTLGKHLLDQLVHLHSHGIIHRDLKPANVVVFWEPFRLRIIDFGLSTISKFSLAEDVYSLWYRAPEIIRGKGHTEKADIWAFGVILASWCGPQILVSSTVKELDDAIASLSVHAPGMQDILDLCLNPDPDKRPTALDLAQHPFWTEQPSREEDVDTESFFMGFSDHIFKKELVVPDPKFLVSPIYTKMTLNDFHLKVMCELGKKFSLPVAMMMDILLMVALTDGPSRARVASSTYLAMCIFSDDIPSLRDVAKAAKMSLPALIHAIDIQILALGGELLKTLDRATIFQLPEWDDVQKALKRNFD